MCLKSHSIIGHVFVECSFDPFPTIFSSHTASLTPPTATLTPLTGIRLTPCATPLRDGPSGHPIRSQTQDQSPKICFDVGSEHTPINLPSRNMSFQQEYDATITASEYLNFPRHSGALSSSHTTLSKLGSLGTSLTKVPADCDYVASRTGIKATCADMDRETVVQVFPGLCQWRREIEAKTLCKQRETGKISTKILERNAELDV